MTTPSGNLHGCPVSFLLGLPGTSKEEIPEFAWIEPVLKPERLVYIGLRDIDEGERKILKENSALRQSGSDCGPLLADYNSFSFCHKHKLSLGSHAQTSSASRCTTSINTASARWLTWRSSTSAPTARFTCRSTSVRARCLFLAGRLH